MGTQSGSVTLPGGPGWRRVVGNRAAGVAAAFWLLGTLAALTLTGDGGLPFGDRPRLGGGSVTAELLNVWGGLAVALLVGVAYLVTRHRTVPDLAARAPERRVARFEVGMLALYGVLVQLGGWTLGATGCAAPGYALLWAGYNFVFYALVPYLVFRRRGYSDEQLSLRSSNPRNDALLIVVILLLESAVEFGAVSAALFSLEPAQLLVGVPASLALNLFGTVLPVMVFLYAVLLPRVLKLTGSALSTAVVGGFAYAAVHAFESWAAYDSLVSGLLSVFFIGMQYFGPGVVKSVLTLRTGNAWVHAWSYHAVAPHVTLDTTSVVDIFRIR